MERFVSVVGLKHYFGVSICKVGQKVKLKKDKDNQYDDEAIMVELDSIGKIGYVANSPHTVAKGTRSAGRIYDTFDDTCEGVIAFIVKDTLIVKIVEQE